MVGKTLPLIAILFLGTFVPLVQDGSSMDFNIYQEPSMWGMGIIAHGYLDWRLLEVGDDLMAYTEDSTYHYEVTRMDYVDYGWWLAEGYKVSYTDSTNVLWLHTCAVIGTVLMVRLEIQERKWK